MALFAAFSLSAQTDTVTFKVDLAGYSGTGFTSAHVNGTFNNWCGACNPMSDADGDGVWEVALPLTAGTIEYKFTIDGWNDQENLTQGLPCTITTGGFTNRALTFSGDTILDVVCWEACGPCGAASQMDLPITFDDPNVNYVSSEFGGCTDTIVADPTDPTNMVTQIDKDGSAQTWAGIILSANGLANPIPFASGNTTMTMRVYSPDAGIEVRMKIEDANDPTISVETVDTTTLANGWETLTFDFANHASGTAAINFANTYDKVVVFPNFGVDGATAGAKTYYVDDIQFASTGPVLPSLPITFDNSAIDYSSDEFGGCTDTIVVDPTDPTNMVSEFTKDGTAQTWAGIVVTKNGLSAPVPFTANDNLMSLRIWSPDAGIEVRMKIEDSNDPTISVETVDTTTIAAGWDTLVFDFSNQAAGTAAINYANTYDKVVVFPNFGVDGATAGAKTYYIDDISFGVIMPPSNLDTIDLPITFDDANVDYDVTTEFGGCSDSLTADPTNASNMVLKIDKSGGAEVWGGITVTTGGMKNPIPFVANQTGMKMRVWSPDAGTDFLLKVENSANGTITCETVATTTVAGAWETLYFNFANNSAGTPALDLSQTYDVVVVFPNFGTPGIAVGAKTYYVDDIEFDPNVGLSENSMSNFSLAPNPSKGLVRLEGLNGETHNLQVTDLNGRTILHTNTSNLNHAELDLSMLKNGIYLITVSNDQFAESRKLIITK